MFRQDNILTLSEQYRGNIHPISYELLGKGRELADAWRCELCTVLLIPPEGSEEKASELIYHGADRVYLYEGRELAIPDEEIYKTNLVDLIGEMEPEVLLMGATHFGRSLAPRIAAALNTGLTADCTDLRIDEEGALEQIRPAFSGNILAHITTISRPVMSTIRYREMERLERDPDRRGEVVRKEVKGVHDKRVETLEVLEREEVGLEDAKLVISGGRGLHGPADIKLLKEFAGECGGEVGCSRPLVDDGWIGKDHQVGYSGSRTKPEIYIACGISGAPQHLAGMRDSDIIMAINRDRSAPIFNVTDYGMVGDLYDVIPKLIHKLREKKRKKNGRDRE